MKDIFNIRFLYISSLAIFVSCSSPVEESGEDLELLSESTTTVLEEPIPAIAFIYQVNSWQEWKNKFDKDEESRADKGMETLGILVSTENSKKVTVFLRSQGHDESVNYTASDELQTQFINYGVIGEPELFFFDIVELPNRDFPQQYRFMISHDVKDYDFWKQKFDEHNPERTGAGLEVAGIARGHENANNVSVMFAFDDMEEAKLFAESDELKTSMEEAGVIGDPLIYWLSIPPED